MRKWNARDVRNEEFDDGLSVRLAELKLRLQSWR
jgi:hypothetical protein